MALIRKAHRGDETAIIDLISELAATAGEQATLSVEYASGYLQNPAATVLLAEVDDAVVGLLSYFVRPNLFHAGSSALIDELVVKDQYRRQGIGAELMEMAIQQVQMAGCAEVSVSTMLDNKAAEAFYIKQGLTDKALLLEKHFGVRPYVVHFPV